MTASKNIPYENPTPEALSKTHIITCRSGYSARALQELGFSLQSPYRGTGLLSRLVREVCFRLGIFEKLWFAPLAKKAPVIIVHDPLITRKYLNWLIETNPDATVNYLYWNMVGKARHIPPAQLPSAVVPWTYDAYDAEKYQLNLLESLGFPTIYLKKKGTPQFDIFFVGADKGRAETLFSLKRQFEDLGLTACFKIMPDGRFSRKRRFYSAPIPYEEVINLDCRARAILNLTMPNQKGITLRDFESMFLEIKLITNNENIENFDFYHPNNIFILGKDDLRQLPDFLQRPFASVAPSILRKYTLGAHVEKIFEESQR